MNKTIKILLLALILQVFLTVVVYFASGIVSSPSDPELLFKIKKDQISKVLLFGPSNKKVVLEKIEDDWLLPENSNFPANEAQINQLLDRLLETKLGSKISQQKSSHSRLRVSDSEYERKVSIFGNNDFESTVFFGSAPSLRQSHARILNKKNVHVVKFSANDIDIQSNDWLKKDIFVLPKKNIKSVF